MPPMRYGAGRFFAELGVAFRVSSGPVVPKALAAVDQVEHLATASAESSSSK